MKFYLVAAFLLVCLLSLQGIAAQPQPQFYNTGGMGIMNANGAIGNGNGNIGGGPGSNVNYGPGK